MGSANAKGELNDQQLDNVAGGTLSSFTLSPVLTGFTSFSLVAKCKPNCTSINCNFNQF